MSDTYDLVTLSEAKDALQIVDSSQDPILAAYITGVSQAIVDRVGPVVQVTVTSETHDGGRPFVYLDKFPVATLGTLIEYNWTTPTTLTAESNTSKTTNDYALDATSGCLIRRNTNGDQVFAEGRNNIVATYTAGRCASTATVPQKFKDAAFIMLKNLWRTQEVSVGQVAQYDVPAQNFPTFAVPNAVKELLATEWQAGLGA